MEAVSWKDAIHRIVATMPEEFTLSNVLAHAPQLSKLFPQNRHIDAKIRQTLQILRDQGVLQFQGGGRYRRLEATPHFSCLLNMSLGDRFTSRSQLARVVIETWASMNLYCLHCSTDDLSALPANAKVSDMMCAACRTQYQIKSKEGRFSSRVMGGEYRKYLEAAEERSFPHLLLVEWDRRFSSVFVVRAIAGRTITPDRIKPRQKLRSTAKRAGWQGCNIEIEGLPAVDLVAPELRSRDETRSEWKNGW